MNMAVLACVIFSPMAGSALFSLGMLFGHRGATRRDADIVRSLDRRHRDDRAIIEEQAEKIATLEAANEILWEEGDFPDDFDDDLGDPFEIDWERDARLHRLVDGEEVPVTLGELDDPAFVEFPRSRIPSPSDN